MDEVLRIIRYIQKAPTGQPRNPKNPYIYMEDELFDLSTMAMEYFKEHIEPTLPEITYFGADYLDFTSFSGTCKLTNDFTSFSLSNFSYSIEIKISQQNVFNLFQHIFNIFDLN